MTNIGAIIFIRSDSRRLPRKTFLPLGNKPLYRWTIDSLNTLSLKKVIVATSNEATDDKLAAILQQQNIQVFRGSKKDIAKRAIDCCDEYNLDYFVRVNGDSPLVNLPLIREGINKITFGTEFITNLYPRSYPYGISCEILQVKKFKEVYEYFTTEEKTHITKYYYAHLKDIKYETCSTLTDDYSKIRFTIDTPQDYAKLQYYLSQSVLANFNDLPISNLIKDNKEIIDDKFIFHKA